MQIIYKILANFSDYIDLIKGVLPFLVGNSCP